MPSSNSFKHPLALAGLAGALIAGPALASAQAQPEPEAQPANVPPPTASPTAPKSDSRPGPLDVVVGFKADSASINAASVNALADLGTWLSEDRGRAITIEAEPSAIQQADFKAGLEQQQAQAVRDYLLAHGAIAHQIMIVSPSETRANGATPIGPKQRTVFVTQLAGPAAPQETPAEPGEGAPQSSTEPGTTTQSGSGNNVVVQQPLLPEQAVPPPVQQQPAPPPVVVHDSTVYTPPTRYGRPLGMSLTLGAGVGGFTDSDTRRFTDTGASWSARLTFGSRNPLALEAGYVGSVNGVNALGLDSDAVLLGSTAEGDLRLNLSDRGIQPYLFGGLGYTHYAITNSNVNTSDVKDSDNLGEVPLGAGLSLLMNGLVLDVRGTMRPTFNDDLIPRSASVDRHQSGLDTWDVEAHLGWEF